MMSRSCPGGSPMVKLKKFIDNFEGYCCVFSLSAMSIIIFIQVVFRYILKASLPWSEEVSRYLLVWTTFFGGAYGVKTGAHIGVEAFTLLLPEKYRKILSIFITLCSMVLCVFIFKYGMMIVKSQLTKGQVSPAMRIPMGYVYLAIPVGMVLFIIRYIQNIYISVKELMCTTKRTGGK